AEEREVEEGWGGCGRRGWISLMTGEGRHCSAIGPRERSGSTSPPGTASLSALWTSCLPAADRRSWRPSANRGQTHYAGHAAEIGANWQLTTAGGFDKVLAGQWGGRRNSGGPPQGQFSGTGHRPGWP